MPSKTTKTVKAKTTTATKVIPAKDIKPAFKGKFFGSLTRGSNAIREDRARSLADNVHTRYKRIIEDLELLRQEKIRERDAALDLSPSTTIGLTLAKDFDAPVFVDNHIKMNLTIRELDIKIETAIKGYNDLFGPYVSDYQNTEEEETELGY